MIGAAASQVELNSVGDGDGMKQGPKQLHSFS